MRIGAIDPDEDAAFFSNVLLRKPSGSAAPIPKPLQASREKRQRHNEIYAA